MPLILITKGPTPESYRVSPLDPHPDVALAAWRLNKLGREKAESYDVTLTEFGWRCECPSWVARCEEKGLLCKHLEEMAEAGLLGRRTA